MNTCLDCKWFERLPVDGICHKNAPIPHEPRGDGMDCHPPIVCCSYWCGGWEKIVPPHIKIKEKVIKWAQKLKFLRKKT